MDPIRRIEGPRAGIPEVVPAQRLPRVERDEHREEEPGSRGRRRPPPPPPPPDDGRPHVDVEA